MMPRVEARSKRPALAVQLIDAWAREQRLWGVAPRPLGEISYRFVAAVAPNGSRQWLARPIEPVMTRSSSGFDLFFDRVWMPDRTQRRGWLGPGPYLLRVTSQFYQVGEQVVTLPSPQPVVWDLRPGYAYPFAETQPLGKQTVEELGCTRAALPGGRGVTLLRGAELDAQQNGIADRLIAVAGQPTVSYRTDRTGQWVLVFPADQRTGPVTVQVLDLDRNLLRVIADVCVVRGYATSVWI
jgi:hypothetical protein